MHVYTLCKVDSEGQAASLAFTSHPRPRAACCCSRASSAGLGEEVHTTDSSTLLPASKERQSKALPHSEPAAVALVAVPRLTQWPQPHAGQWRNMCVSICTNPAGGAGSIGNIQVVQLERSPQNLKSGRPRCEARSC